MAVVITKFHSSTKNVNIILFTLFIMRSTIVRVTNSFLIQPSKYTGCYFNNNVFSTLSRKINNSFISSCRKITMNSSDSDSDYMNDVSSSSSAIAEEQKKLVKSMLYRINECNICPPETTLYDFIVDNEKFGKVTKEVAKLLTTANISPPIFELQKENEDKVVLTLSSYAGKTYESRTKSIMLVMEHLKDQNIIKGWRNENYPVCSNFYSKPKFLIERAAAPFLGIQQYGVHINGLVVANEDKIDDDQNSIHYNNKNRKIKMWIARRSKTKSKYPNMLDHIVAGGQPYGISLLDNVIKECEEEAGIPEEIVKNHCYPVGCVNYQTLDPISVPATIESNSNNDDDEIVYVVSRSVLFCYDIYLPNNFQPKIVDGEVQDFFLWDLDNVAETFDEHYHDPIKPNCYLVIIDFLIRMGYVTPDAEGYLDILKGLRNDECL